MVRVIIQFEEQPQQQVVDRYASHRGYTLLKPPHTTKQALTRVRDRVQDQAPYHGIDLHPEEYRHTGWLTYMRDIAFPTSRPAHAGIARIVPCCRWTTLLRRNGHAFRRRHIEHGPCFGVRLHGVMNARHTGFDTRQRYSSGSTTQHTWPADLCLAETGKTQKEPRGEPARTGNPWDRCEPDNARETSDHGDSRRLASGLSPRPIWARLGMEASKDCTLRGRPLCSWKTDRSK